MRGVVIAAGRGMRMGALGESAPKSLIPIDGKPLLEYALENFRGHGIDSIAVVTGHQAEAFTYPDLRYHYNAEYLDTNILHSLMKAEEEFEDDLIITYSDIWFSPDVLGGLIAAPGDIVVSVDTDWQERYEGRTLHPWTEAEKAILTKQGAVQKIGKHLPMESNPGEFIGLFKLSKAGAKIFRDEFHALQKKLKLTEPFQQAKEWRKSYVTDFIQWLADKGQKINASTHKGGWLEMDTPQDYESAAAIIRGSSRRPR